jgi:hypothetical protein
MGGELNQERNAENVGILAIASQRLPKMTLMGVAQKKSYRAKTEIEIEHERPAMNI